MQLNLKVVALSQMCGMFMFKLLVKVLLMAEFQFKLICGGRILTS